MKLRLTAILKKGLFLLVVLPFLVSLPGEVESQSGKASLYLSPEQGTFEVGSTFNISFFVNTGGGDINAVRLDVRFPPDKIQVSDPTVGNSFISIWVEQPQYSNTEGFISLQGGLPSPGINTSAGLVSTVTFRAKSPGTATISVLGSSQVLANDGQGTNVLSSLGIGVVEIIVPAPEGPVVVSSSHGDLNRWYRDTNVNFSWKLENIPQSLEELPIEYSWSFTEDPLEVSDNTPEGSETSIQYEDVEDGIWYFHIKARMGDEWGSTTHRHVMIDQEKPAEFSPVVDPPVSSVDENRIVSFLTSDQHSGLEHYELKIESLSDPASLEFFFVEVTSPYTVPELPDGTYKVTVRAYDNAGNWQNGIAEFEINTYFFRVVRGEVHIGPYSFSGGTFAVGFVLLLVVFALVLLFLRRRYKRYRADRPQRTSSWKDSIGSRFRRPATESTIPDSPSQGNETVPPSENF